MVSIVKIAGSGANGSDGGENWSNPGNITSDDSSYASVTTVGFGTSETNSLKAQNFGFALPNSTIDGIIVTVSARKLSGSAEISDSTIQLLNASGTAVGSDKSTGIDWGTSFATKTFGGSSDKWSTTLTYSDINDSDFGVKIRCKDDDLFSSATGEINWVKIEIFYTVTLIPIAAFISNTSSFFSLLQTSAFFKAVLSHTTSWLGSSLSAIYHFKTNLTNNSYFTIALKTISTFQSILINDSNFQSYLRVNILIKSVINNSSSLIAALSIPAFLKATITNISTFSAYLSNWYKSNVPSNVWSNINQSTSWDNKDDPSDIWINELDNNNSWSDETVDDKIWRNP